MSAAGMTSTTVKSAATMKASYAAARDAAAPPITIMSVDVCAAAPETSDVCRVVINTVGGAYRHAAAAVIAVAARASG